MLSVAIQREDGASSFQLNRGEIVGLGGLVGIGTHGIGALADRPDPACTPRWRSTASPFTSRRRAQAFAHGIAYLTEDRKRDGLFANLSVTVNCSAATLRRLLARGLLREDASARRADRSCSSCGWSHAPSTWPRRS